MGMTGPDGVTHQLSREQYNDSNGRSKRRTHKQLGDQAIERIERPGTAEVQTQRLGGHAQIEQPAAVAPSTQPVWDPAWNPLVEELAELGFSDAQGSRAALQQSQGDLKGAVKALVEAERAQ